jgi:DHA1 family bicyclomycin/chloramphenicol resistance-like MFS transporter
LAWLEPKERAILRHGKSEMTEGSADRGQVSGAPFPIRHAPLWLLALITLTGTLAIHIFVPALPLAARDLDASTSAAQLSLSAYIVGLSLGQLAIGPIADHLGRKPVLIAGMIVYALSSVAAMVAPTIYSLIVARLFQALGGCAGLVLGRAILRDTASGDDVARRLSFMNLMVMAGPGLSPLIGSALAVATGWRSIFAALSLLGLINLLIVSRCLPETASGQTEDWRTLLRNYMNLLRAGRFVSYAFGGACATTSIYAFIGAAPFIFFDQLHRPMSEIGLYLMINIAGAWFGSLTVSRLVMQIPAGRLMLMGNLLSCASALAFLLFVLFGSLGVISTIIPMLLFSWGAGVASPTALAEALRVNPSIVGSASGLYGVAQMGIGAICTALSGIGSNPALAVGVVMLSAGLLAQVFLWLAHATRR